MILTRLSDKFKVYGMKKHISELPIETVLRTAQKATQQAAISAVKAGRTVTGWKDGKLIKYGLGALPYALQCQLLSTHEQHQK